ncbi:MAG: lipoate--protein ligase family protein [Candidatus Heimdallarchaeota archaeon]|nr:lipoate--protein ligase family protein [Candidatus Heimdallarchaeota archaeon]MCK5049660.1 lipoate--protein ligase family protein [Candidatus Heimdallarchaeota archaeon]
MTDTTSFKGSKNDIRVIPLSWNSAFFNMAIDEILLDRVQKGLSPPTLRFYGWEPSAVTLGRLQDYDGTCDEQALQKYGFDVTRRITGGGSVFHDEDNELTYSLITHKDHPDIPSDQLECFRNVCTGLIKGLSQFGIEAHFAPINDIQVVDKKISGNAQIRRKHGVLIHGTILAGVNPELMFDVLRVDGAKLERKGISNASERVTSMERLLGNKVDFEELSKALYEGLSDQFTQKLYYGEFSSEEIELANKLQKDKYQKPEWVIEKALGI